MQPVGTGLGTRTMVGARIHFGIGRLRLHGLRGIAAVAALACGPYRFRRKRSANSDVIQISSTKNTSIKIAKGKPKTIKTNAAVLRDRHRRSGDRQRQSADRQAPSTCWAIISARPASHCSTRTSSSSARVDIEVTLDTDRSQARSATPFRTPNIEVSSANGRLVLSGSAKDAVAADKATRIAIAFLRRGGGHQFGQHLLLAAGPAQCPLRRDQPPGRRRNSARKIAAAYTGPIGDDLFNSIREPRATRRRAS